MAQGAEYTSIHIPLVTPVIQYGKLRETSVLKGRDIMTDFALDRITFDPLIMGGRACIRGMRITVSLLVNLVANEMTPEEILEEYPDLEPEDIRQALQYAALLAREELHHFPEKRV